MPKHHTFAIAATFCALLLGSAVQGCSSRSGHSVPLGDPTANLEVTNNGPRTVTVYVDRRELGSLQPGQTRAWDIYSGVRPVHMREVGESTLTYYGDFNFFSGNLVGLTYQPGVTHNLTVFNDSPRTLEVFVDLIEIGEVPPKERGDFLVSPGRRDIDFRERSGNLQFVGEFVIPNLAEDQELVLIYQP